MKLKKFKYWIVSLISSQMMMFQPEDAYTATAEVYGYDQLGLDMPKFKKAAKVFCDAASTEEFRIKAVLGNFDAGDVLESMKPVYSYFLRIPQNDKNGEFIKKYNALQQSLE